MAQTCVIALTDRFLLHLVPGNDQRKLKSATKLEADCLVYDLEDSVPFSRKGSARSLVFDALEVGNKRGCKSIIDTGAGTREVVDGEYIGVGRLDQ